MKKIVHPISLNPNKVTVPVDAYDWGERPGDPGNMHHWPSGLDFYVNAPWKRPGDRATALDFRGYLLQEYEGKEPLYMLRRWGREAIIMYLLIHKYWKQEMVPQYRDSRKR